MYLRFAFEDGAETLEYMAQSMRRKLDLAGAKIGLKGWQAMTRAERLALSQEGDRGCGLGDGPDVLPHRTCPCDAADAAARPSGSLQIGISLLKRRINSSTPQWV
jgi:hypothetical protein